MDEFECRYFWVQPPVTFDEIIQGAIQKDFEKEIDKFQVERM